ncbi:peptide deformylase [Acidimicrobium ferrooxidans DSM 10331]|uniref:Peptide deformylase n=1 Tax=Acidimicrobium ferrooxidans (strain DSM 10331 / JCM 15462 / NBRC 103882 / ICP) TaxID=525909 RepID=C7M0U6_ACIFD|nr:peptide deformylase [Acidimicrobium ferrooxidans]ACU54604.1 peptide deformylase [Acidimicrobium ferrooxidans DSM 10331]
MPILPIRTIGDPVLSHRAREVETIDARLDQLIEDMIVTMHEAPGVGLAAPQVGVDLRLFVWDIGDGPDVAINPEIVERTGTWRYEEGCLSVPGYFWPIERPRTVLLRYVTRDGEVAELEGSDLLGRVFQHETDHLDGVLLIERLDEEERREAKQRIARERWLGN